MTATPPLTTDIMMIDFVLRERALFRLLNEMELGSSTASPLTWHSG
jgi:hypothetical protein